jgi:sec-independent protein translocase protein TatA
MSAFNSDRGVCRVEGIFSHYALSSPVREYMIEGILQPRHLLVILAVALFLFGPKKLPELGKGLAEGIRGFKNAIKPSSDESA